VNHYRNACSFTSSQQQFVEDLFKLLDLLSCELLMFVSLHPSIKSIFETGGGRCKYYVIW